MELKYPNSPGMTGDARYTRVEKPEQQKADDGRLLDETGQPKMSYDNSPELSGSAPQVKGTVLRYRDGKIRELPDHSSISEVVAAGVGIDLKRLVLDGQTIEVGQALNRDFRDSSFRDAQIIGDYLGSDFRGADLRGCRLSGRFQNCDFTGALFDEKTSVRSADFSRSNLAETQGWSQIEDRKSAIMYDVIGLSLSEIEGKPEEIEQPDEEEDDEPEEEEAGDYWDEEEEPED